MLGEPGREVLRHRSGPPAPGWRQRGAHLGLALRVATAITQGLPEPVRYGLADIGGLAAHRLLASRASIAAENYLSFTGGDRASAVRLTRRAFRNYARTVLDFLVLERLLARVKATQGALATEPLRRELAQGRSVIVVTPHFGNWDLGAAVTATCGRPVHAVADQFGPPAVDQLVRSAREKLGVKVIPSGPSSAREALRALRRGEVLCLAADIDKTGSGVGVTFLGRPVFLPAGPATLAIRTGASVIPGYVRRLPAGGYEAALLAPLPQPTDGPTEQRVAELTQLIADAFEEMIRLDPSQWFAFHHLISSAEEVQPQ